MKPPKHSELWRWATFCALAVAIGIQAADFAAAHCYELKIGDRHGTIHQLANP